jgi:hypothetical protein
MMFLGIKKVFTLLSCGLLLIAGVLSVEGQTAQQIAKKAFESTVLLVMEGPNGQPFCRVGDENLKHFFDLSWQH